MKEGRPLIVINGIYTINDNGSINDVCHICRNYFSLQLNALMALVQLMTWTASVPLMTWTALISLMMSRIDINDS